VGNKIVVERGRPRPQVVEWRVVLAGEGRPPSTTFSEYLGRAGWVVSILCKLGTSVTLSGESYRTLAESIDGHLEIVDPILFSRLEATYGQG